jgi:hypothetical protein
MSRSNATTLTVKSVKPRNPMGIHVHKRKAGSHTNRKMPTRLSTYFMEKCLHDYR